MDQSEFNKAFSKAVKHTLTELGVDYHNPLEMQKDFATMREVRSLFDSEELKRDLAHLRKWRKSMEEIQSRGVMAAVGLLLAGTVSIFVIGFKVWTKGN